MRVTLLINAVCAGLERDCPRECEPFETRDVLLMSQELLDTRLKELQAGVVLAFALGNSKTSPSEGCHR